MSLDLTREAAEERHQQRLAEYDEQRQEYEKQLERAGYGPDAREQFINAASDPAARAEEWDNEVIPAAAAAGEIPEDEPVPPRTPAQEARDEALTRASEDYYEQHPDGWEPWEADPEREAEYQAFVDARAAELMAEAGYEPDEGRESAAHAELDQAAESAERVQELITEEPAVEAELDDEPQPQIEIETPAQDQVHDIADLHAPNRF